jgi:dolichol-phosphate mannosyltransferase
MLAVELAELRRENEVAASVQDALAPLPPGRILVSLATYNEVDNVPGMVDAIHAALPDADLLICDDNSPDGTGKLADRLAADRSWLHVLHRPGKMGLGSALVNALQYADANGFDYWINMDADFSHPPAALPALLRGMANFDVMIGSRYVAGGGINGWDAKRHFMSKAINFYSRLMLGLKARDTSGSYRCYRVSKLRELDLKQVYSTGYAFMEEFLFHCKRLGCRIGETPIVFENRRVGQSKINSMEAIKALWALFYVGLRYRLLGR